MGIFVNSDNSAFQTMLNSKIYVDKTGLLNYTNEAIDTDAAFICNSRPRRFGKSTTVDMLIAYYSKGCDSETIFENLEIGKSGTFKEYLNKFDVIHFDVQWCIEAAGGSERVVSFITKSVIDELRELYPEVLPEKVQSLTDALSRINAVLKKKFIVIVDEWDVLIRDESANQKVQEEYINFLRGIFKGNVPKRYIALAYLTGILPIKKLRTQSALNNFDEFTMLDAGDLAPYIGFTEDEVEGLCKRYNRDFNEVKRWYNGYLLENHQVYNPKAVVGVMTKGKFKSYWSETGTFESIVPLINMDFDGLKNAMIEMLSGSVVEVDISSFQNDMVSFSNKDDVLTCLIHLGYLGYDQNCKMAFVPNEEIRQELTAAIRRKEWDEMIDFQRKSLEMLDATLEMDAEVVASGIENIHDQYVSTIQYNDENSLSSVLTIAYLSSMRYYFKPIRELPTGKGFADFVYIPKIEYTGEYPALVVELKWNKSTVSAIQQIKEREYPKALLQYIGNIILVAINYDKKTKKHQCIMERFEKR